MTRLTIVILAAALLGAAALQSVAHAQEATGSISGRIVFKGEHRGMLGLFLVSADSPQPIDGQRLSRLEFLVDVDDQGNFSVSGLADGDYLLFLPKFLTPVTPLPEGVDFIDTTTSEIHTFPALRVTVAGGQAVTGVEIPILRLDATPTPLPPPGLPGSISGHITIEGLPEAPFFEAVHVVSADVPQPIPLGLLQTFGVDDQNNFVVTGLGGGDYFLLVGFGREIVEPQSEVILFPILEGIGPPGGMLSWPAIRVTLPAGGAVTGLEIIVTRVDALGGPTTGAGPGSADGATGRLVAGLAVAALLLLAGGVAVWARSRRLL